jgi:hypothetical protein
MNDCRELKRSYRPMLYLEMKSLENLTHYPFLILYLFLVVQWSQFLTTDPEASFRFPALSDFLRSSGSGTGVHSAS